MLHCTFCTDLYTTMNEERKCDNKFASRITESNLSEKICFVVILCTEEENSTCALSQYKVARA